MKVPNLFKVYLCSSVKWYKIYTVDFRVESIHFCSSDFVNMNRISMNLLFSILVEKYTML